MPLQTMDNAEIRPPPKKKPTQNKPKTKRNKTTFSLPPKNWREKQQQQNWKKSKAVQTFDISLVSFPYVWPTRYLICGM